jgi:FtsH-binding integral membrane protein
VRPENRISQAERDQSRVQDDEETRQAIVGQYRDWLIPGTIFSSVSASIFLLVVTTKGPNGVFLGAMICSFLSIASYVIALFYAFTRVESITIYRYIAPQDPGDLYFYVIFGTFFLFLSLVVLAFAKSEPFGVLVAVLFVGFILTFVRVLYKESRNLRKPREED